jgi:hypothetical protein
MSAPTPVSMWMVEFAAGSENTSRRSRTLALRAAHRRNQQGVKDRYRAAGSVGEQVLNWPGPGDHERNDAETYRMERDFYWLLGRVWAPIPSRVGDSRRAGREPEAIRRIPGAVIRYSRASQSASYRAPASTTEEVPAGIYPQVLWLSGSGSTTRFELGGVRCRRCAWSPRSTPAWMLSLILPEAPR